MATTRKRNHGMTGEAGWARQNKRVEEIAGLWAERKKQQGEYQEAETHKFTTSGFTMNRCGGRDRSLSRRMAINKDAQCACCTQAANTHTQGETGKIEKDMGKEETTTGSL